jgi:hypothetical protein
MPWIFEQSTGRLYNPSGGLVATGYAGGNCGKNKEGVNNPDAQDQPSIGPLPCGFYTFAEPVPQSRLGPFAIPLTPDDSNVMFGRGSFYIHGDSLANPGSASEGCVIMPRNVRNDMWSSDDHRLQVVRARN